MRGNAARSASSATNFGARRTGHFEDAIGSVDDGDVFVDCELPVYIELLEFGLFFGQVVVVFPEAERFAIQSGESVEQANVVKGIGLEFVFLEDAKDFGEGDLDECFLKFRAVGEFAHVGAVLAEYTKLVAPFLVAEVILIAALAPFGEMTGLEVFGVVAEVFDDLRVGATVVEPVVDFVADGFGEVGDFAVAFVAGGDAENVWSVHFGFWLKKLLGFTRI